MPKVLRIINRFNLGGPTYNAAYLTKYLAPEFETLLIGGMKEKDEESSEFILRNLDVNYRIIPEMRRSVHLLKDVSAYREIKKIIREFEPDIVHTHASKAGALGRMAAVACKVPVIVHTFHGHVFHSYFGKIKTTVYKRIERYLANKTTALIAISKKQKYELGVTHKIASPEKIHVVHLGFDLLRFQENYEGKRNIFRKRYNLTDDEIAIGIVGRLTAVKNHELFLEAIHAVKNRTQKKIRAFIIGDGEKRKKLQALAHALHLSALVVFTSWETEIDKVYPGLDIVCLTSFNEGTPVCLIEAQAANKAIVATDAGGVGDTVIPDKTALLSSVSDKEEFFSHLLLLIENPSLRNELGKAGQSFVQTKFTHQRLAEDVKNLYGQLLNFSTFTAVNR